ncbi:related to carboxylic ester hydrolases-Aspergillus niger [Serendipita indica DSM 11827]|uniref:Related to carboxylic ester hydrolases-Aspergillus niger n=1 Tax=Serendipita indica (strain DSM 11827) TaxID=1109443 RepID=G4TZF0_SERID|nr:related to carboxylic ester hydrolases-Aspergillus niger [Serendipita indica DSM 11827]
MSTSSDTTGRTNYVKLYLMAKMMRGFSLFGIALGRAMGRVERVEPPQEIVTISSTKGKRTIRIHIYRNKAALGLTNGTSAVHINWHGSGWMLPLHGQNGGLIRTILSSDLLTTNAYPVTIFDCSYALSPEHPAPAPYEDARDVYDYLMKNATKFNVDMDRVTLSGTSAGATLALGLAVKLASEQVHREGGSAETRVHPIKGISAFYPPVNWLGERATVPEPPQPKTWPGTLMPPFVSDVITIAHFFSPSSSPLSPEEETKRIEELKRRVEISPALAPTRDFPPILLLWTTEYDHLSVKAEALRERLQKDGGKVEGKYIKGVGHGWDLEVQKDQFGYQDRIDAYDDTVKMIARVDSRKDR